MEQKTLNYGIVIPSTHRGFDFDDLQQCLRYLLWNKRPRDMQRIGYSYPHRIKSEEVSNYIKKCIDSKTVIDKEKNKPYDRHQAHHRLDSEEKRKRNRTCDSPHARDTEGGHRIDEIQDKRAMQNRRD